MIVCFKWKSIAHNVLLTMYKCLSYYFTTCSCKWKGLLWRDHALCHHEKAYHSISLGSFSLFLTLKAYICRTCGHTPPPQKGSKETPRSGPSTDWRASHLYEIFFIASFIRRFPYDVSFDC